MNVEFLYEDLYILAVNKPSNLIVHPTLNPLRPHLLQFLKEKHEDLHLLHRLDADTTGVLILAKGSENTKRFSLLFSNRNVEKVYHAIVEGRPPFNETTIRNHLAPMIGMKSQFTSVHSGGKVAETRFKILSKGKKFSFVEAIPLTGRTHQIRVHLAELGRKTLNPLVFWGIITVVLTIVLILIVNAAGIQSGVYLLFLVPVVAYLVIMGFFITYVSKLNKERNRLLADQVRTESTKAEEFQKLNHELETYAKQLFDKDFELTFANKRLQNLEQAKSKFVSVTTHQLRTPLSAIKWTFHMLLQGSLGPTTPDQHNFIEKGFESTQRMIAIINDLLNVDYIEADRSDFNFLSVDLPKLIDGILFEFTNQAESKAIKLKFDKPKVNLPPVAADPIKLGIVLENLLDNAVKYTPQNGQVTVSIGDARMNSARSNLEVVVSDTGIGISEVEGSKIFHRFFRGSNAIKVQTDGTGLGLFISRDIIEKHGGAIWFESILGQGTKFHFTIPVFQK